MTAGPATSTAHPSTLFEPGRNCWRIEPASRVAFLIDGDSYFKALVSAARRAQRSILITGWDFHSRTRLLCPQDNEGKELLLGDFLNELARTRPDLQIHILIWDYPMIFGLDREWAPLYGLGWKPHRRVHLRYDNTHPVGGSHHQKIVVIDDTMAFNGGIDLTARRWDTCDHAAKQEHRVAGNTAYPPFHDMMMAVEGAAAAALGELVRERWRVATGHVLPAPTQRRSYWPPRRRRMRHPLASPWHADLPADISDVDVAIARTSPPGNGHEAVREIDALYADMIAAARVRIYIENQYFTADRVGDALEARLREAEGPEVFVVLRKLSHGWLEEMTMEALRTRLIARLREADAHQRLRVVYPYIDGLEEGTCIDVHSKMMIIDDELVRIGSANIANRSMGMDTECDLTIEARGRADVQQAIRTFRARLLAEHLGSSEAQVQEVLERTGRLAAVVDELRDERRTLRDLEDTPQTEPLLNVASVADPEKPVELADLMKIFSADDEVEHHALPQRSPWRSALVALVILAGLTALWRLTPASELFDARRIAGWARDLGGHWWAPVLTVLAYTPAAIVMFPRSAITLFAVVAFGPWMGFVYAMTGLELAAWITYIAGQQLDRDTVRRMAGRKLNDVIQVMRRRGLIAMTALRLVPLAPFTVEGVVAGAVGIRLWHFMLGTAIGMLPGTLAATVFGHQLAAVMEGSARINYWLLGGAIALVLLATWAVRRWLIRSAEQLREDANQAHDMHLRARQSPGSGHGVGSANAA